MISDTVPVSFRMQKTAKAMLAEMAAVHHRSLTGELEVIIAEAHQRMLAD